MSGNGRVDEQGPGAVGDQAHRPTSGPRETLNALAEADGRPRVRVQVIERTAIVRFAGPGILCEKGAVREVMGRLLRLTGVEGHSELLVNFSGVRYTTPELFDGLDAFRRRGCQIRLCGLDPVLRDVARATQTERPFIIGSDEAEALGLLL